MKSRISALMDGELERHETRGPLEALGTEGEARQTWRTYHLISDAMRDTRLLSAGFSARVCAKLAEEPTVIAPARFARSQSRVLWRTLPAAASVAAVALVGWLAFAPQDGSGPAPQAPVAQVRPQAAVAQAQAAPAGAAPAALVQPPDEANDYLLAHQGYSPRNSLQGVAPYVRMVSGER
ncbi:MAG: sigma-E factor negative regulatory protein [Betaproteobacteria bacterium]|nr:sigma-E factor negative regulatory protein [Betaproteobacteria bacterium]